MSFFNKLKSKLFKSSSKLDEGIDAIVEEQGEIAPPEADAPAPAPDRAPPPPPESPPVEPGPGPRPELAPEPFPAPQDPEPAPAPPEVPQDTPPETPPEPPATVETETPPPAPEPKRGVIGRLIGRTPPAAPVMRRPLDDAMLEQLEDLLISADMGVDTAARVTANMAEGRFGKRLSTGEIKALMAAEIARIMEPVAKPLPIYAKKPQVVLIVGVNGSGKTTTIGKLAAQFRAAGKSVVIAAGDTFRAAAVEQLQVWGERAGVPVLTAPQGSDPASLAFDAMGKAEADGADLLMIDTAGRLQNRADLMEELAKIVRVIRKKDPDAPHNTVLVLDATTGQNALSQVEIFQKISDVSGLVMTKLDGTARGGVLVALADKFGLPIHAIGVGEQIDDLAPFDPEEFAAALTGADA
ncbi:signal recognition particle-docking protein FtsY [Maribius pontilimi]|uniref:Signal recognition particle receptor FtsY n=1 Tax=Palleronia pontilimi TaxID=1964209 RepID=A0A934IFW1_9RHOB|nr:signal recognition particle-docking protein FtsY [Palleronia pontilimi]MBJ3762685.1 signal recognition particle-docking protein FtsY [Palleronia pontilimi]